MSAILLEIALSSQGLPKCLMIGSGLHAFFHQTFFAKSRPSHPEVRLQYKVCL